MEEQEYLGTGVKFPPQADRATGRFMLSGGKTSVKESVYIILMTQKSERWLRPEFGSRIMSYAFMDTSVTRLNMMARELRDTLLEQEPRIADAHVEIGNKPEKGCLIVNISYVLAETDTEENMVFPFYLDG